jgi:hypothetical protein
MGDGCKQQDLQNDLQTSAFVGITTQVYCQLLQDCCIGLQNVLEFGLLRMHSRHYDVQVTHLHRTRTYDEH